MSEYAKGLLALAALFALGVLMLAKPRLLWRISTLLTVKGGEPTEAYMAATRVGGALFALGAVITALVLLLKDWI